MKLIGKQVLRDFSRIHADARPQLAAWESEVLTGIWRTPQDIKLRYQHASFISKNRIIFNIKGGRYRLLVRVDFEEQLVICLRAGTHEEYDGWEL